MNSQTIRGAAALFVAATLAGCAVGPNYKKPETPAAPAFAAAEPAVYSPEQAQTQFWKQFHDETLDKLVDDSLNANHDLRIALGRLVEARAARRESLFDLAPTVTASGGYADRGRKTPISGRVEAFSVVKSLTKPDLVRNSTCPAIPGSDSETR